VATKRKKYIASNKEAVNSDRLFVYTYTGQVIHGAQAIVGNKKRLPFW